jgi:hypothetical protein
VLAASSRKGASFRGKLPLRDVVFRSRLHSLPRNSGVVQTSTDMEMSQVPLHRIAFRSIVLCTNRHFSEVACTKQQRLLRRMPCRAPPRNAPNESLNWPANSVKTGPRVTGQMLTPAAPKPSRKPWNRSSPPRPRARSSGHASTTCSSSLALPSTGGQPASRCIDLRGW